MIAELLIRETIILSVPNRFRLKYNKYLRAGSKIIRFER